MNASCALALYELRSPNLRETFATSLSKRKVEETFVSKPLPQDGGEKQGKRMGYKYIKAIFVETSFPQEFSNFKTMKSINDYISIDPEILAGTPVFKGTRVAIKTLFDYLEDSSLEDFLQGFPSVTREQAEAVIELAAQKFLSDLAA